MSQQRSVREPAAPAIPTAPAHSYVKQDSGSDKPGTDPRSVELPSQAERATMQGRQPSQPREDLDDRERNKQAWNRA